MLDTKDKESQSKEVSQVQMHGSVVRPKQFLLMHSPDPEHQARSSIYFSPCPAQTPVYKFPALQTLIRQRSSGATRYNPPSTSSTFSVTLWWSSVATESCLAGQRWRDLWRLSRTTRSNYLFASPTLLSSLLEFSFLLACSSSAPLFSFSSARFRLSQYIISTEATSSKFHIPSGSFP